MRILCIAVLLACLFLGESTPASQIRSEAELELLKQKIEQLKGQLQTNRKQEQSLILALGQSERKLTGLINRQQNQLEKLEIARKKQIGLNTKLRDLEIEDRSALLKLKKLVRLRYILGQQDTLMLVLNQQEPNKIARNIAMYRYIVESRNRQIKMIQARKFKMALVSEAIVGQQIAVGKSMDALNLRKSELQILARSRQLQLESLQAKLSIDESQVEIYHQREQELVALLRILHQNEQMDNVEVQTQPGISTRLLSGVDQFEERRGQLLMPTDAEIVNRFGEVKPESGLIWEGLMFNVHEGQNVNAIYPGQVVFADWFRGYGQLLVLDHGGGYMSLYGHNQLLHVELGTSVEAGQLIAFAGATGGLVRPGLYFEIRHNGVPDDPLVWCHL